MDMLRFLETITEEMKMAVLNGMDGAEFAATCILKHGQQALNAYNEVAKWGDQILTRISMYPPLGSFRSEHPVEFDEFMGQFMDGHTVNQLLQEAARPQQPQQQQPAPRRVVRPKPGQQTQ